MCNGCTITRECQQCGCPFEAERRGTNVRRFCDGCRELRRQEAARTRQAISIVPKPERQCVQCGLTFQTKQPKKHRFCSKPCCDRWHEANAASRPRQTCQHCETLFLPKASNRTQFCSRDCACANKIAAANGRQEAARLKRMFANLRQCIVCSAAFVAHSSEVTCGKDECRERRDSVRYLAVPKTCRVCGGPCTTVRRYRSQFCESCRNDAKRLQRRRAKRRRELKATYATARHKSDKVLKGLQLLITQAGNQCPCCGLLMSKKADVNSDRALELDHAMPLSRGGTDHFPNLRPLCRKCNGLKRDFIAPDIVVGEWLSTKAHKDLQTDRQQVCINVSPVCQNGRGLSDSLYTTPQDRTGPRKTFSPNRSF